MGLNYKNAVLAGCLAAIVAGISQGEDIALRAGVADSTSSFNIEDLDTTAQFVDQEFDPALLDNLPMPVTPPAHVTLPKVIVEKGQWRGGQCGITRSTEVVFRKQESWVKFWSMAISPYSPRFLSIPIVDFSKDMVVGVFMGEQPYPNHDIEIRSVKIDTHGADRALVVSYRNTQRMQAVFNPPFNVQPFHLIKTPAFPGRVTFVEAQR